MDVVIAIVLGIGLLVLFLVGVAVVVARFYRKVDQGHALIVNRLGEEPDVTFTGGIVYPIIHRAEVMDISVKTIVIDRRGSDGLICQDNIRADIKVNFFVRVNKTKEDVLKVAQSIGCRRASDQDTLEELFVAKFSEALKTVGKQMEFEQLYTERDHFKDGVLQVIGTDLNGYVLDDAAIDYLEQTPVESLDKENILDSQGIRKITAITSQQNVHTNDLRQNERKAITKQNLEADEAIMELERRRADAEAKQHREIATVKAREEAETRTVQAQEMQRAKTAQIKAAEEIEKTQINKERQVEVATKDKERVLAIKTEQVEKDRDLEMISREREVELQRIAKEKALEVQRKEIAEVVRARIAVDKNVAEEEERIKDLRTTAEAQRMKSVTIINAEAEAEEQLVKDLKRAEAADKAAEFKARDRLTLASAELDAADKEAKAKIRHAEGVQAERAAEGLALVKVKEANAVAIEKEGLARARVSLEAMQAKATGEEKLGLSQAKVKDALLAVTQREGLVEAEVTREKMLAEAKGHEEKGLATVKVKEADAGAIQRRGEAEANAIELKMLAEAKGREADASALERRLLAEARGTEEQGLAEAKTIGGRLNAEASGLASKAEAMKAMEGRAWEHEEFRIRLEHDRIIKMQAIDAQKSIADSRATILAAAFSNAEMRIVGGDGEFFDRFVAAAGAGASVDALLENSSALSTTFGGYLSGERQLPDDLKDIVAGLGGASGQLRDVSVAALMGKLINNADDETRSQLMDLVRKAQQDSPSE
jgi:uncharacterized membrane protein YqiK